MAKTAKKDINLYALVAGDQKRTVKTGLIAIVAGLAALVLMGSAYAGLKIYAASQQNAVQVLQQKTEDPVLKEKLSKVNELMQQINTLRSSGDVYKKVRLNIIYSQAYCDDFTDEFIDTLRTSETIVSAGNIVRLATITGLSYDGSQLHITATSSDNRHISNFMDRLNSLELFSEISYSGYSLATESGYTFTVNATFYPHEYELPPENEEEQEQTDENAADTIEESISQAEQEGAVN